jgi:hypothetical protein
MRWTWLVIAGCSLRIAAPEPDAPIDPCPLVEQRSFHSVMDLECGLGPNGPLTCRWAIAFDAGLPSDASAGYSWSYSDVGEMGRVRCNGTALTSDPSTSSGAIRTGSIDANGVLVWDGQTYTQP